ncbi:MAG: hypothetical protein NUW37_14505 [Planctomycetes bacterium]|nr:hypothetical protein [Planctomycetota bacterium]
MLSRNLFLLFAALFMLASCSDASNTTLGSSSRDVDVSGTITSNLATASSGLVQASKLTQSSNLTYGEPVAGISVTLTLSDGTTYTTTTQADGTYRFTIRAASGADAVLRAVSPNNGQIFENIFTDISDTASGGTYVAPETNPGTTAFVEIARQMLDARRNAGSTFNVGSDADFVANLNAATIQIDYITLREQVIEGTGSTELQTAVTSYRAVLEQGVTPATSGESVLDLWEAGGSGLDTQVAGFETHENVTTTVVSTTPPRVAVGISSTSARQDVRTFLTAELFNAWASVTTENGNSLLPYLSSEYLAEGRNRTQEVAREMEHHAEDDFTMETVDWGSSTIVFASTNTGVTEENADSVPAVTPLAGDRASVLGLVLTTGIDAQGRHREDFWYMDESDSDSLFLIYEGGNWREYGSQRGFGARSEFQYTREFDSEGNANDYNNVNFSVRMGDQANYHGGFASATITGPFLANATENTMSGDYNLLSGDATAGTLSVTSLNEEGEYYTRLRINGDAVPDQGDTYTFVVTYNDQSTETIVNTIRYGANFNTTPEFPSAVGITNGQTVTGDSLAVEVSLPAGLTNTSYELRLWQSIDMNQHTDTGVGGIPVDSTDVYTLDLSQFSAGDIYLRVSYGDEYGNDVSTEYRLVK